MMEKMLVSTWNILRCELQINDVKIRQVYEFKLLGSGLTQDEICNKEIGRHIEIGNHIVIANSAFQKLS